ncbi:cell division inhibitor SepF [Olsenella profusa DSM 13989]|uniref:cell division protein SepF n=1 Tax=Olsenella profusa TaxID=138595 RepID=UPI00277DD7D1|nr:cell division protein SepF [Olsenella profusa]MDP9860022.1 cell division inhibitor SepF [Olsenella profusa DSM 13989]
MGFFDNLRDRLHPQDDGYYDDDEYDEYYDEGSDARPARRGVASPDPGTSGVLGNTRRPEAESVSVYTRSGRPVDNNRGGGSYAQQAEGYRPAAPARRAPEREYAPREREYSRRNDYNNAYGAGGYTQEETAPVASHGASVLGNTTDGSTPADIGLKPIPRQSTSGKLPPYVLKPASYDDVQMVVRRVRTGQPVVLAFKNTNIDTAKRILDFCFGLSCGISGSVEELGDRVFAVIPQGIELSQTDVDKLVQDGTIER